MQQKDETLHDFLGKFNNKALLVQDLNPKIALHLLVDALQLGPFTISLAKREARTKDKFYAQSEKYINLEDFERVGKNLDNDP